MSNTEEERENFYKHLMSEIHELNGNIMELAGQISGLKKYLADVFNKVVWIQKRLRL